MRTIIEKNGFALRAVREVAEMQGRLWELEHPKSGAKLVWLDRPDENMTFAIGFRTIPTDSTGVFHILEHSVLGGSEKYPVKEPFVELLKSSLKTFLNAMTFPDKTVYPVSSRNRKDFHNLVGIYMDAVLHPLAISSPNVFRQEGWRLELPEDGEPMFQGVVYNEMKGAYSDVRSVLQHAMLTQLFPDSCYRHESGGDPEHIPELTYEQFCSEHARYYHPSNALIVLDGMVDLDDTLAKLNEYLSPYTRQEMVFPIPVQEALPFRELTVPYEIGAEESAEGKTIVAFSKLFCGYGDQEALLAAEILANYLADGSEGKLKKPILAEGLGADVRVTVMDGIQQSTIGWQVWNTDADKLPRIREVIRDTLTRMADEGLDRERLLGCFNSLAFQMLDRDGHGYPRGLMETITILEPWLYGGDPAQNLAYRAVLDSLRAKLDTGYFEELLRRTLLDESTGVLMTMVPDGTLGAKRVAGEKARVQAFYNSLDEEALAKLRRELDTLHAWQQTPDSPEALATIPMLSLSDVSDEISPLNYSVRKQGDTDVLIHHADSDLVYMDLFFEASDVRREELPVLKLLCAALGMLETGSHSGEALQTLVRQKIGSLDFELDTLHRDADSHRLLVAVKSVCLPEFRGDTANLIREVLRDTRFENKEEIRNLLRRMKNGAKRALSSGGNRYAASRVTAHHTSAGAVREYLNGFENARWLNDRGDISDAEAKELLDAMAKLAAKLFTRERLTVSLSGNAESEVSGFCDAFPSTGEAPALCGSCERLPKLREGILVPGGVGYAAKGANLSRFGGEYRGGMYVLAKLVSLQYLWAEIRVKGGAYGSGFAFSDSTDVVCYSFRDPSPARTIGIFDACPDFVERFCEEHPDMTKFILGAVADADPLLGAAEKISLAESRWFKGTGADRLRRVYREILNTTAEDLTALSGLLRSAVGDDLCVVGGKEQLDAVERLDAVLELN